MAAASQQDQRLHYFLLANFTTSDKALYIPFDPFQYNTCEMCLYVQKDPEWPPVGEVWNSPKRIGMCKDHQGITNRLLKYRQPFLEYNSVMKLDLGAYLVSTDGVGCLVEFLWKDHLRYCCVKENELWKEVGWTRQLLTYFHNLGNIESQNWIQSTWCSIFIALFP